MSTIKDFPLGIAPFHFSDLYKVEKLPDLHLEFWKYAEAKTPGLKAKFDSIEKEIFLKPQIAEVLILTAKTLGDFVSKLFNVTNQTQKIKQETRTASIRHVTTPHLTAYFIIGESNRSISGSNEFC
jgi:hypothetical protein